MSNFDLKKMATAIDNLTTTLDIMLCCKDDEGGKEILESCEQLDHLISSLDDEMNVLKEDLVKEKQFRQSKFQSLIEELKTTEERCNHMIINFPFNSFNINEVDIQHYNQNYDSNEYKGNNLNNVTNISNMSPVLKWSDNNSSSEFAGNRTMSNCTMSNNTMLSVKSFSSQASKQVPFLKSVDNNEMDAVPKYMKGRLTSMNINTVIDGINAALENKYDILRKPKSSLKKKDLDMYNTWKIQQNNIGSGQFFVTADDITKFSETKVDKTTLNIVPILRHLKRLKESRTGGSVYYLPY